MNLLLATFTLPFAVHIGQDMLRPDWCLGGFAVAGLMMLWGAWRTGDEEISRIAVMTAAFFVASSIHVPVPGGPPAHLLLTGLVGVVLGRRAALAIPVGLFLQAVLFQHGALTALGANTCVMVPPALLSWLLFNGLCHNALLYRASVRAALVVFSAFAFILSGIYAAALLLANWGTNVRSIDSSLANQITFHPVVLMIAVALALLAAWAERRSQNAAEFPLGLLIGELSVLLTLVLNALFLILGGQANWHSMVLITFLIHLPLAVLEGLVLGFTVGFLARVKPEMLLGYRPRPKTPGNPPALLVPAANLQLSTAKIGTPLIVVLAFLAWPEFAYAHKLYAFGRPLPDQQYQVQSFFPAGYPPRDARAQVFRADGTLLAEGELDTKGLFLFHYERPENLRVVIRAAAGTIDEHTAVLLIAAKDLSPPSGSEIVAASTPAASTAEDVKQFPMTEESLALQMKDYLIGIGFLLAAAAFLLGLRNSRQLRAMRAQLGKSLNGCEGPEPWPAKPVRTLVPVIVPPETPLPGALPTAQAPG